MTVSKKLRNNLLNAMSEITMDILAEKCPEDQWDDETHARHELITDITTTMSQRMAGKLAALAYRPKRKPKRSTP